MSVISSSRQASTLATGSGKLAVNAQTTSAAVQSLLGGTERATATQATAAVAYSMAYVHEADIAALDAQLITVGVAADDAAATAAQATSDLATLADLVEALETTASGALAVATNANSATSNIDARVVALETIGISTALAALTTDVGTASAEAASAGTAVSSLEADVYTLSSGKAKPLRALNEDYSTWGTAPFAISGQLGLDGSAVKSVRARLALFPPGTYSMMEVNSSLPPSRVQIALIPAAASLAEFDFATSIIWDGPSNVPFIMPNVDTPDVDCAFWFSTYDSQEPVDSLTGVEFITLGGRNVVDPLGWTPVDGVYVNDAPGDLVQLP